jgi:hypothetical protein
VLSISRAAIFIIAAVILLSPGCSYANTVVMAMPLAPPPVPERQIESLKQKATQGDVSAQTQLAGLYLRGFTLAFCDRSFSGGGLEVPAMPTGPSLNAPPTTGKESCLKKKISSDYIEAFKYFKQAAEGGDAWSQTYSGWFYDKGKIVSQDYKAALKWYQMAAAQEYPYAQDLIGRMYRDGHGVPQNYSLAAEFFKKAALQHARQPTSPAHLARLYFTGGAGFPRDYEKAFFWLNIGGNPAWPDESLGPPNDLCCDNEDLTNPLSNKDLEKHLTSAQIEKVKKQIIDYKLPPPTKWSSQYKYDRPHLQPNSNIQKQQ